MTFAKSELLAAIHQDRHDVDSKAARAGLVEALTASFKETGHRLTIGGQIMGTDRRDGLSPFQYGDDAVVGFAVLVSIAGELLDGAGALLSAGNRYAAATLIRQLVEVEYLTWAFAENYSRAADWLRSDRRTRLDQFSPAKLRDESGGRFPNDDYHRHCEQGGHPTPEARTLLGHDKTVPVLLLSDALQHAGMAWRYSLAAVQEHGWHFDSICDLKSTLAVVPALERWDKADHVRRYLLAEHPGLKVL